ARRSRPGHRRARRAASDTARSSVQSGPCVDWPGKPGCSSWPRKLRAVEPATGYGLYPHPFGLGGYPYAIAECPDIVAEPGGWASAKVHQHLAGESVVADRLWRCPFGGGEQRPHRVPFAALLVGARHLDQMAASPRHGRDRGWVERVGRAERLGWSPQLDAERDRAGAHHRG